MRIASYAKILAITILVILLFIFPPLTGPVWLTFFSFAFVIAIACLGLNLVVGHTGLLSLGHAAYFGIGGYTVALLMFWYNIRGMEILLLSAVGIATLVALAVGYVASRLSKMYFAVFTLAITQVVWSLLVRNFDITGGASGIYVRKPIMFGQDLAALTRLDILSQIYYYYIAFWLLFTLVVSWFIINSPLGLALRCIRENPERTDFIGISVARYKWGIFTVSGAFCGLAGALFAVLNGVIHPGFSDWFYSLRLILPIILGGMRYILGPVVGILVFNILEMLAINTLLTWKIMAGVMIIIIAFFIPEGVMGVMYRLYDVLKASILKGADM